MNANIQNWSVEDVVDYIDDLEVDGFTFTANDASNFRREMVNGRMLLGLEKDDLNTLGLHKFPKRNALYKHLKRLKAAEVEANRPRLTSFTPITRSPILSAPTSISQQNPILQTLAANVSPTYTPNTVNSLNLSPRMTPLILPQSPPTFMSSATPILAMPSMTTAVSGQQNFNGFVSPLGANSPVYGSSFPPPPQFNAPILTPPLLTPSILPNQVPPRAMSQVPFESLSRNFQRTLSMDDGHRTASAMADADDDALNCTEIRAVVDNEHLVEFPAIYQGINSHSTTFVLMQQEHITALNKLTIALNLNRPKRIIFAPLQGFESSLPQSKVQYGWIVGSDDQTERLPFNAFVLCRVNVVSNEVVGIRPVVVSGRINHVNQYGQTWVTSDVQIDAVEQVASKPSNLVSNIISFRVSNVSHTSLQQRTNSSYMLHDPEREGRQGPPEKWKRGLPLNLCLKLSTRTNPKCRQIRKPIFVQGWNVKVV